MVIAKTKLSCLWIYQWPDKRAFACCKKVVATKGLWMSQGTSDKWLKLSDMLKPFETKTWVSI